MAKKKKKTLLQIESEYIHGNSSYRVLAEKYSVPFTTITYYAKHNKWVEKRRQFRDKLETKKENEIIKYQTDKIKRLGEIADTMCDRLQSAVNDEENFHKFISKDKDTGKVRADLVDAFNSAAFRQLTGALKELTDVIRDVYNLPKQEKEKEKAELKLVMPEGAEGFDV